MSKYHEDEHTRIKVDKLLKKNAALEASLGIDSTKKEHAKVKVSQNKLFNSIKELDEEFYRVIVIEENR